MELSAEHLNELAARVEELAGQVRGVAAGSGVEPAVSAVGWLDRASMDLRQAALELAARAVCGLPWGVCPEHGNTLSFMAGVCSCRVCGRRWDHDRLHAVCAEPVAWVVVDGAGSRSLMCEGHVLGARLVASGSSFSRLAG